MKSYILINEKTKVLRYYDTFGDAEAACLQLCSFDKESVSDYFIGKMSHTFKRIENHTECVLINQVDPLTGYIPQEGDVFMKTKRFNTSKPYSVEFERRILKVNADTVVVINRMDEKNPQVLPTKQWFRWIQGAELIKKEV